MTPIPSCRKLLRQAVARLDVRTALRAGKSNAIKIPMTAITINSSIKVKAK
jgi:hypothetical protein